MSENNVFIKNEFDQPVGLTLETWQGAKKPLKALIKGSYCILEPLNINKHGKKLFDLFCLDISGWTYLPYGPFPKETEFFDWLKAMSALDDPFLYTILDSKTQSPIGMCAYLHILSGTGSIEVGHLHFSSKLKQTPAATEAMYLMMHYAFEELGYRRYEWKCDSLNNPSRKAALRLGFKFEGIFRQHMVYKYRNRDTAWFSILDSEWPELKKRFNRWLSPENFDKQGKQIFSLNDII